MKKVFALFIVCSLLVVSSAMAAGYKYVEPAEFKKWLESGKTMKIVDIQVPADFQKHHFKGSLETNAFPVKSEDEKKRLNAIIPQLAASQEEIVVICPRGGGGAKNTYDYLKEKGIAENRLIILKGGMQGWPYEQLTAGSGK